MKVQPGLVVLFGSGETSASGRRAWDWLFSRLPQPIRVAILETPAGFQPNSAQVAGRVAEFLSHRLQNYRPQVHVIPARGRDTPFSPDNLELLTPMLSATVFFLGAGSPTYAVRQLEASLAWEILLARHRLGAAVVLASAATISASAYTLPVYEIYKVGEKLHWHTGLDFFASYGLIPVFIPHWNNAEGGAELDTSRCFMGRERFARLLALLPANVTVVGIDEHTALVVDLSHKCCRVMGQGGVTLLHQGEERTFSSGESFALAELGALRESKPEEDIRPEVWQLVQTVERERPTQVEPPPEVLALTQQREEARARRDWKKADALRDRIADLGWRVIDTPQGPRLEAVDEP